MGAAPENKNNIENPRKRWIAIWLIVCSVILVLVFFLGTLVRSPWDGAIENSKTPLVATAVVHEREFEQAEELVRGRVELGTEVQIVPDPVVQERAVVTALMVEPGQSVTSGDLLAKISGQPMFLLTMDFPLYRTITGGDHGDDVFQIQQELKRLGLYSGPVDGVYGIGTADAVGQLYRRNKLEVPSASIEALEAVRGAEQVLADLQKEQSENLPSSESAAKSAKGTHSNRSNAVEYAKRDLEHAKLQAITPLRMEHFWATCSLYATVVKTADVGSILIDAEQPLVTIRAGEVKLTTRVPVSMTESYGLGAQARAVMATDPAVTWGVVVVDVGEFVTESDEFDSRPGRNVTFQFEQIEGLTKETEVVVEPLDSLQSEVGLAVPLTALREGNGATYVNVIANQSELTKPTQVPVSVLTVADGFAHVTSETLMVGDTVIVGGK